MKFFKTSILALLALAATTFTACSDDDEYVAADATAAPYFASTLPAKVDVPTGDSSFVVTVSRSVEGAEATYELISEDADTVFTVPSQVTFAAGSKSADIVINCDVEKMGLDTYHPLALSFADGVASPYGESSYSLRVCIAGKWNDLGMCTYNEPILGLSYEVLLQESESTPGYYRLKAPYGSAFLDALELYGYGLTSVGLTGYDEKDEGYLYVHAENPDNVIVELQDTGLTVEGVSGDLLLGSIIGLYYRWGYDDDSEAVGNIISNGYAGSIEAYQGEENGYVYFPSRGLVYAFEGEDYVDAGYASYANSSAGVVLFSFPGVYVCDYTSTITFDGLSTTTNSLYSYGTFSVQASSEIEDALFGVMKIEDVETDIEATYNAILNGTIETYKLKAGDSKSYEIELEGAGKYCAMVLGYDNVKVNGEYTHQLVDISYKVFTVRDGLGTQHNYKHLGTGYFQDGWIYPMFGVSADEYIYEVEVYESKTEPGVYRIMNPYGVDTEIGSYYNEDENDNAIDIDASDKDCICIVPQYSGFTSETIFGGEFYLGNTEGLYYSMGYTKNEVINRMYKNLGLTADAVFTNYDDELATITVPKPLLGYDDYENFGYSYNAEYLQDAVIWLPEDESASAPAKFKRSVKRVDAMISHALGKSVLTRAEKPQAKMKFKLGKQVDLKKF
jgi:hypothetical protein